MTAKELQENGFVYAGVWHNRVYYKKKGFEIVEHHGYFYECDDEHWSGKGDELKTIEDVDNAYTNYIQRKFEEFKELFG